MEADPRVKHHCMNNLWTQNHKVVFIGVNRNGYTAFIFQINWDMTNLTDGGRRVIRRTADFTTSEYASQDQRNRKKSQKLD